MLYLLPLSREFLFSNLSSPHEYHDSKNILMGNSNTSLIMYTGTTMLYSPARSFSLKTTLCFPKNKTNLVLVLNFCRDNTTLIKYDASKFLVKDLKM